MPPNIQAIIATQTQVVLDDVAQLADKIAVVTSPPCVARVSSSGVDISTLTSRIDELARQVAALSASPSRPRSPSQTRRHTRLSSPAPDIAGNTAVLKSMERDAPRPVCGSRETWKAVARGGEQLQQLSQPPLCDGSAHKDELLGRHRHRSLRLTPFPSSRTPDTDQL